MIDFRYHLVSLVAVFLALAIGIVLGAGPLRDGVGQTLTAQVEQLRVERDEMRASNDALGAENSDLEGFVKAAGAGLVTGTMHGEKVATIADHSSMHDEVESTRTLIEAAGGQTGPQIELGQSLWDPAAEGERRSALTTITQTWPGVKPSGTSTSEKLASIIATILAPSEDLDDAARLEIAKALSASGVLTLKGDIEAVDSVLVLSGEESLFSVTSDSPEAAATRSDNLDKSRRALVTAFDGEGVTVAVGGSSSVRGGSEGLVSAVRTSDLHERVSSIDMLTYASGPATLTLALAGAQVEMPGAYGSATDAEALVPDASAIREKVEERNGDRSEKKRSDDTDAEGQTNDEEASSSDGGGQ